MNFFQAPEIGWKPRNDTIQIKEKQYDKKKKYLDLSTNSDFYCVIITHSPVSVLKVAFMLRVKMRLLQHSIKLNAKHCN